MVYKDWDAMGSDISKLETFDDDEQPLPQNVYVQGWARWQPPLAERGACMQGAQ